MAKYVLRLPNIPEPPRDKEQLQEYIRRDLGPAIVKMILDHLHIFPDSISGELRGRTYTEATKPTASDAGPAAIILSTDAATPPQMSDGTVWLPLGAGGGGGDNITVNGAAVVDANFDSATPAAPANAVNVTWQKDAASPANISAYLLKSSLREWAPLFMLMGA